MQRSRLFHAVLSFPWAYDLLQSALGARRARQRLVEEVIQPVAGQRIIDIGCGTAAILEFLPDVEYLGVDLSASYVESARRRFGQRANFVVGTLDKLPVDSAAPFDLVLAIGLLHHLDDDEAKRLFAAAARFLVPNGRMITVDPTLVEAQHAIARFLVKIDRGLNVRTPDNLTSLAKPYFGRVSGMVSTDMLRIPYAHVILKCSRLDSK